MVRQVSNNVICPICGLEFRVKPSRLKRSKNICCSRKCSSELRKSTMKGKNNHQYGIRGKENSSYISGKHITPLGYRRILNREHPFSRNGYVLEHRLVAEKHLLTDETSIIIDNNKYLKEELVVHHIDGDRLNNDPSNLEIMTFTEHQRLHYLDNPRDRCEFTGRFISEEGDS